MTTVFGRKKSRSLSRRAAWLCSRYSHGRRGTNSDRTTVMERSGSCFWRASMYATRGGISARYGDSRITSSVSPSTSRDRQRARIRSPSAGSSVTWTAVTRGAIHRAEAIESGAPAPAALGPAQLPPVPDHPGLAEREGDEYSDRVKRDQGGDAAGERDDQDRREERKDDDARSEREAVTAELEVVG